MARFIQMKQEGREIVSNMPTAENEVDQEWLGRAGELISEVTGYLDRYQFNLVSERLYEFSWHEFADKYIEDVKNRVDDKSFAVLSYLFLTQLKLLHPLMPFVTEVLYRELGYKGKSLMIESWPQK